MFKEGFVYSFALIILFRFMLPVLFCSNGWWGDNKTPKWMAIKVSPDSYLFSCFYNLWDFLWALRLRPQFRKKQLEFLLPHRKKRALAKWFHIPRCLFLFINIYLAWIRKCAQKARTNLHFMFPPLGEVSHRFSRCCFIISMVEKNVLFLPLQSVIDYFFSSPRWIFHEAEGNIA